ncbi:MAG: hypothetical protein Ta2G_17850 [Termitinemataceae bacterium]|nr:MAG: hypothetical protein Ta2G_17850 [Termitinemataceae bacterium]
MAGREQLVKILHAGVGLTLSEAASCVDTFTDWITETLGAGESIELRGLGTFRVTRVTLTKMACTNKTIPSHGRVVFRPGKKLKKAVLKFTSTNTGKQ